MRKNLMLTRMIGAEPTFLRDPLDVEEKPRIDVEDDQILIIVDIPCI